MLIETLKRVSLGVLLITMFTIPALAFMPTAKIGDHNIIQLEVAATPDQIERGLMYRTSLAEGSGMIFLFTPPRPVKFWMYHTLIPLDMCFVLNGRIVKIFENVPPCRSEDPAGCVTYPADGPGINVTEVIELPGGYTTKHGIKEGAIVSFQLTK
jgi:uncharacterized membrane protein (UPF0127 family)